MFEKWITQLQQELEIKSLKTEEPGVYALPLEEETKIMMTSIGEGGFSLSCNVGACPKTNRELFFTQALLANLFGQGTRSGVLGLSEDGNLLTLSRVVDYTVDYKDFRDTLEDFINVVDFWREEALAHK